MKKPSVLIAAIVAVVGLGAAVAVAKERTQVETSATIKYKANDRSDPDRGGSFLGEANARKGCQKGRTVVLYEATGGGQGGWRRRRGSDRTNDAGKYEIKWREEEGGRRTFFVHVNGKRITKRNDDKVACKVGTSNRIYLDRPPVS